MSSEWEVVGKKKDKSKENGNKKAGASAKGMSRIKVEDILPMDKIQKAYATGKSNTGKENKKPVQNDVKKTDKKLARVEKNDVKPKKAKSIEQAINSLDTKEFRIMLDKYKSTFPNSPNLWITEMTMLLNFKLNVDIKDSTLLNKPPNYPLSIVPASMLRVLDDICVENINIGSTYTSLLTTMIHEMNKNANYLGYKIFLQYFAKKKPEIVLQNIDKYVSLRNQHKNMPHIASTIIWCVGQAALQNFEIGVEIFKQLMLPLINAKQYTTFIVNFLISILRNSSNKPISRQNYVMLMDLVFVSNKVPQELQTPLISSVTNLHNSLLIQKKEKFSNFVEPFMKHLGEIKNQTYQNNICFVLLHCMEKDENSIHIFIKILQQYGQQSIIFLKYLDKRYANISKILKPHLYNLLLNEYKLCLKQVSQGQKVSKSDIKAANSILENLKAKMGKKKVQHKKKRSSRYLLYLILIPIASFVGFDVISSGSWTNSRLSKALNESGVYDYTAIAADHAKHGTIWVHNKIETQFPGLTETTVNYTMPYIELGRNLRIVTCNMVHKLYTNFIGSKIPIVIDTIEAYAPGFIDVTKNGCKYIWDSTCHGTKYAYNYLANEVFVGQMSPQNMTKTAVDGLCKAKEKVVEGCVWVYEKIQETIK